MKILIIGLAALILLLLSIRYGLPQIEPIVRFWAWIDDEDMDA